jgi:tetratricopeptide (TPR) repeat protein
MPRLTLNHGLGLLRKKDYQSAHAAAIATIKADLNDPLPYFFLGIIAADHGNFQKALELYQKADALGLDNIELHVFHAKALSTRGQQNAAKQIADKATRFETNDAHLNDTLGVIYSRAGYHEDAIPFFEKAVAKNSKTANFYYNLAASAQFIGDFEKARAAYENTLRLDTKFYRAWSSLVSLRKQTAETHNIKTLIRLFEEAEGDAEGRLQLGHALAKTYEDLGQHEESLGWLLKGKAAKRTELRYDRGMGQALFAATKQTSVEPVKLIRSQNTDAPIFVVGLPRTGTTLVDRILSSHSDVTSAGELNVFAELVKAQSGTQSNLVMDAETFKTTSSLDLASIGKSYVESTRARARGAKNMVDKMPLNFFYVGLIHRALPNARIIALRRGAMDSCLSNFRQLFATQYSYYNYTFDLEDTAWFYRQFDNLMSHWRGTLPQGRFMEVQYEDIVFDQENQTRRLLEFCGLDWEEACMNFHENAAPVATASSVQVRQPLYSGSIGRWKKYGDKLEGLKSALGDLAP